MKIGKLSLCILLALCCFSCHPGRGKADPPPQLPKPYLQLLGEFKKDKLSNPDSAVTIPISLLNSYLQEKIDTQLNSSVNPVDLVQNRYGNFFIIQVNCSAGGYCHIYTLLVFDKTGHFIKSIDLGETEGDEGFSRDFTYTFLSDTTLEVSQVNTDNDTDDDSTATSKADSTSKAIKLILGEQ